MTAIKTYLRIPIMVLMAVVLSSCTFQPLHAPSQDQGLNTALNQVSVSDVDTRVGQQVRNHLLFLLHGGNNQINNRYEARITVTASTLGTAAKASLKDTTAGSVKVAVSYQLLDTKSSKEISSGHRFAIATFDRTSQEFANKRAVRDAQNRAGKQVAEFIRIAIATDLRR